MGNASAHKGLEDAKKLAEIKAGHVTVSSRWHRLPRRLHDDYKPLPKVLGTGSNGEVYLAMSIHSERKYAIKSFNLTGLSLDRKEHLQQEVEIFLMLDHPHIARLVDVYESEDQLNLVMECMDGGELFHRVSQQKKFSEKNAADAMWQMLLAVNYMHLHGIIHRDIKLENFLYESKDSSTLKLIDFGLSKVWEHSTKLALSCGTLSYCAPEVLTRSYTLQCDMWSVGVIAFILLTGHRPFTGSEAHQVECIKTGKYRYKKGDWSKLSAMAWDFVQKLLVVNPLVRLTAAQALEHPWIKQRDDMLKEHFNMDSDTVQAMSNFAHSSRFRRGCLSAMAWSLTSEERQKVEEAFMELDVDRRGSIKLWQMQQVLENQFHVEHEEVALIFEAMDPAHQDEIHYSEFLAAMVSTRIQLHDTLLRDTFRRLDTHNTGYISQEDIVEVFGEPFDAEELGTAEREILHNGVISLEDFMAYLKSPSAVSTHHQAAHRVIDQRIISENGGTTPTSRRGFRPKDESSRPTSFHQGEEADLKQCEDTRHATGGGALTASSTPLQGDEVKEVANAKARTTSASKLGCACTVQ